MKNKIICNLMVLTALSVSIGAQAETMYKCATEDGSINYQATKCTGMKELATKNLNGARGSSTSGTVSVMVAPNGAYYTEVYVNGTSMQMVVDTGAAYVALPISMGKSLGLSCGELQPMVTAAGVSVGCRILIPTLQIGSIILKNVAGLLAPNLAAGPLLGQSALRRLMVAQMNGTMIIRSMQ